MRPKTYFITGIDTGIGKTLVTVGLMQALKAKGEVVYGMKPVASGCIKNETGLVSDDALLIQNNGTRLLPYNVINPVALENPCSPNIAARLESVSVDMRTILHAYDQIPSNAGYILVEGVGGWRTPFSDTVRIVDFVRELHIPVIVVVGLRLGCINHAILTIESLKHDGIEIAGWVSSQVDPEFEYVDETVSYLAAILDSPLIAQLPYIRDLDMDAIGAYIDVKKHLEEINF